MIEVELRAFVDELFYEKLLIRFRSEGHDVSSDRQVTYYLDSMVDTRVQLSRKNGKLWQKLGHMHDVTRPEIEIPLLRNDAKAVLEIMQNLGFAVKVMWFRERVQFRTDHITVSLDHTIGYGRILEVEAICESGEEQASRNELSKYLATLGIAPTPKQDFDAAYQAYLSSWRSRTAGLSESWLDEGRT